MSAKTKPLRRSAARVASPDSLSQLSPNPRNPRKPWQDDAQRQAFLRSLQEFGDLSGIVYNQATKQLVGGHKRVDEFIQDADAKLVITERLKAQDGTGTKAYGYVTLSNGTRFAYREVHWNTAKEAAANLAANQWGAEWDITLLKEFLPEIEAGGFTFDTLGFGEGELDMLFDIDAGLSDDGQTLHPTDSAYTGKLSIPVYTPRGDKPPVDSLVDCSKTKALIDTIEKAKIKDQKIVEFLRIGAQRHTVFDYEKIAEFYAHATPEIQRLMEASALVLIDYNKAVENGYVILSERLKLLYGNDHSKENTDQPSLSANEG